FACIEDLPAADVTLLSAIDNCGEVTIVHLGDEVTGDDCDVVITRTYRATDECGNFADYVQTIFVADEIAPVLAGVPASVEVSCDEIPEPAVVTATDNCDLQVVAVYSEIMEEGDCPQAYTLVRTWTATDACGNTVSASQIITVSDDIAPVITGCPADLTVDCVDDVPAPNTALVTATDICGVATITHLSDVQDGDECSGTIIRTYRATDECGNFTDCVQTIEYNDTEAPVFVNPPANITVDCDNIPEPTDIVAIDNCSEVTVSYEDILMSGGCPGVYYRIWSATDACGNVTTHEQFINMIDTVAPVFVQIGRAHV